MDKISLTFDLTDWAEMRRQYKPQKTYETESRGMELLALLLVSGLKWKTIREETAKEIPTPHPADAQEATEYRVNLKRMIYPRDWLARILHSEKDLDDSTSRQAALRNVSRYIENINTGVRQYCARNKIPVTDADDFIYVEKKRVVWIDSSRFARTLDVTEFLKPLTIDIGGWEKAEALYKGPLLKTEDYAWLETRWASQLRHELAARHTEMCLVRADSAREAGQEHEEAKYIHLAIEKRSPDTIAQSEPLLRRAVQLGILPDPRRYQGKWPGYDDEEFGRKQQTEEVCTLLRKQGALILEGGFGVGKTRLAVEVSRRLEGEHPGGLYFATLADKPAATSYDALLAHMPGLLDERTNAESPPLRRLLLLDNCEHIAEVCARLIAELRHSHPAIDILATSRFPLRTATVSGGRSGGTSVAQVYKIPTLPVPDAILPNAQGYAQQDVIQNALPVMRQNDSVRLFLNRARLRDSDFELTADNAADVASLCRIAGGVPFCLEIIAAQVSAPLHALVESLGDIWPDQLEQCINWSYTLLPSDRERLLLRRLAVFPGGWTLKACLQLCSDASLEESDVRAGLHRLRENYLVNYDDWTQAYHFPEVVRLFALKRLQETQEAGQRIAMFQEWFYGKGRPRVAQDMGRLPVDELRQLVADAEADEENSPAPRGLPSISEQSEDDLRRRQGFARILLGHVTHSIPLFDQLLSRVSMSDEHRSDVYFGRGIAAYLQLDWETARRIGLQARKFAEESGSVLAAARAASGLGVVKGFLGEEDAREELDKGIDLARQSEEVWTIGFAYSSKATYLWHIEERQEAEKLYRSALDCYRLAQDKLMIVFMLNSVAHLTRRASRTAEAACLYLESLDLCRGRLFDVFLFRRGVAGCVLGTAGVLIAVSRTREAVVLWGAAQTHFERAGAKMLPPIRREYEASFDLIRQEIGEIAFERACQRGEQMTLEAAQTEARRALEEVCVRRDDSAQGGVGARKSGTGRRPSKM